MPYLEKVYEPGVLPASWGFCIYGRTNSRKTSSLRTMPGHGHVLDWPTGEGGTNVLKGYGPRIQVRPMETWEDFDEALWWFVNENPKLPRKSELAKKGEVWADDDPRWREVRVEWVAHDTVTAGQEKAKHVVLGARDAGIPVNPHTLNWKEYDHWYSLTQQGIWAFKNVPNLISIWLAQELKKDPNDDSPEGSIGPNLRDRPLEALEPSMMMIARYFIAKNEDGTDDYRCQLQPTMMGKLRVTAKVRHPIDIQIPTYIRNIHLGNLLNYALKGQGEPPEEVLVEQTPELQFA